MTPHLNHHQQKHNALKHEGQTRAKATAVWAYIDYTAIWMYELHGFAAKPGTTLLKRNLFVVFHGRYVIFRLSHCHTVGKLVCRFFSRPSRKEGCYHLRQVNLHRNSNTTIFEQTRNAFEYEDPRAWGANWTGLFFTVNFTNEKGVDSFGLRKEWLSLVLQSIVLPAGHSDKTGLQCVSSGKCGDEGTPQYLLKALPSGELVPISVEEVETSEQTGRIGSMLKFAYDAYDLAYERVLGEKEKLPYAARMRFQFLGKWLARAHIVTDLGFAPMGLHRVIYQSLVAGYVVTPQTPSFYSEEDTIPACEKLAAIWRRRSPQELQSYGWLSCDEVKDHTGKYTQASFKAHSFGCVWCSSLSQTPLLSDLNGFNYYTSFRTIAIDTPY